jgi:hypothetical protein
VKRRLIAVALNRLPHQVDGTGRVAALERGQPQKVKRRATVFATPIQKYVLREKARQLEAA